jgi:hypothetical protein
LPCVLCLKAANTQLGSLQAHSTAPPILLDSLGSFATCQWSKE